MEPYWISYRLTFNSKSTSLDFISSSASHNPYIRHDIEGLALLPPYYLVASSQGNFSYSVFDRRTKEYLTSFKVMNRSSIDGVEETDGIEIMALPLGDQLEHGIFVAQDGFNYQDSTLVRQNFKIVKLEEIQNLLRSYK